MKDVQMILAPFFDFLNINRLEKNVMKLCVQVILRSTTDEAKILLAIVWKRIHRTISFNQRTFENDIGPKISTYHKWILNIRSPSFVSIHFIAFIYYKVT